MRTLAEDFGRLEGLLSLVKLRGFYAAAVFPSDENRFEDAVLGHFRVHSNLDWSTQFS